MLQNRADPQERQIRPAAESYRRASQAAMPARDTELAAFGSVTRALEAATAGMSRIKALGRNHDLWSLLIRDLGMVGNRLPDDIKVQLVALGTWSMRYSTLALLQDLPLQPLIYVNRNIADGLREQAVRGTRAAHPGEIAGVA